MMLDRGSQAASVMTLPLMDTRSAKNLRFTVEFDDSERITLDAALDLLKEECERQIAKQPGAPYLA